MSIVFTSWFLLSRSVAMTLLAALPASSIVVVDDSSTQQSAPTEQSVKQQNDAILKELRAIRELLEGSLPRPQRPLPQRHEIVSLRTPQGHALGSPTAPITLVEISDLQCPFCREHAATVLKQLRERWIDTGKLRYLAMDFPLDFHAQAMPAARAARCAGEEGQFWPMRLALLQKADQLSGATIAEAATTLGLNAGLFSACLASSKYDDAIKHDIDSARRIGVSGTPSFVVGRSTGRSEFEGVLVVGLVPTAIFEKVFDDLLDDGSLRDVVKR